MKKTYKIKIAATLLLLALATQNSFGQLLGGQIKTGPKGTIATVNCSSGALAGTFKTNVLSAGTKVINYTGGNAKGYGAISIPSTGVTGLTAAAAAGNFANGAGSITLAISGTPSSLGTATFEVLLGGQSCSFTVEVRYYLYGGSDSDSASSIIATADGGFIMAGQSFSPVSGDVTGTNKGSGDVWVVKLDGDGAIQWQRLYGGSGNENIGTIVQTPDGGYILGTSSASSVSGDVSGTGKGSADYWILRLDASGNKLWDKLYGGALADHLFDIILTADGGCAMLGRCYSRIGGDVSGPNSGATNMWILKLDANGNKMWNKLYGGNTGDAEGATILQTPDGGYIVGGFATAGSGGSVPATGYGLLDSWVMKLDALGNITWRKLYGGSGFDYHAYLALTADGGYIMAAMCNSPVSGLVTLASKGNSDIWVAKLDASGSISWQKRYGGSGSDSPSQIRQTADGGYIIAGSTSSPVSGDITAAYGNSDGWILKLDATGNMQWQKSFGGSASDRFTSIDELPDGSFILAGSTGSSATGTIAQANNGSNDFWVVKVDASGNNIVLTGH